MPDLIGQSLGKYRIVARLGRGGMAEVYKAYQPGLDRFVAIKVLHSHLSEDKDFVGRFEREARAVANLRHPNIVQVFDFDVQNEMHYMAMEFVQGPTFKAELEARREQNKAFDLEDVARIVAALSGAIDYAHSQGMVHRDLKPANFILTRRGQILILDFGIAKIVGATQFTATGAMSGTPAYMSPEQGRGERGDERSDIYSLGIVLYEMVTGRVPYEGDTPFAVIMKHITDPLPTPRSVDPDIPEAIEAIILKALNKEPDDRYQTGAELAAALKEATGISPYDNLSRHPIAPIAIVPEVKELDPSDAVFSTVKGGVQHTLGPDQLETAVSAPATPPAATVVPFTEPSKSSRRLPVILGGIGALIVIAVIIVVIFGASRKNSQNATATTLALANQKTTEEAAAATTTAAQALLPPDDTPTATATIEDEATPTPTNTPDLEATVVTRITAAAEAEDLETAVAAATQLASIPTDTPIPAATETPPPTDTPLPTPTPSPTTVQQALPPTNTPVPAATATPTPPQISGRIAVPIFDATGYNVEIYDVASGNKLGKIPNARQPTFRADGEKMLVNGEGGGRDNVWEVNGRSYRHEQAVSVSPSDFHPFYSPDGQRMVIGNDNFAIGSDGQNHPFLFVQCNVKNPQQEDERTCQDVAAALVLVPDGQIGEIHGSNPVWAGNDLIVYKGCNTWQGGNSCGIFRVGSWANKRSSNGMTPAKLAGIDGTDTIPTDAMGSLILYHDNKNNNWDVYLTSTDGGPTNLTNSPDSNDVLGAFSPDGEWVAFVSDRGGSWAVWAVSTSGGGGATKLFDLPWTGAIPDWLNERISWGSG